MADAITVLTEDHRTVEGLFEKIEGLGDGSPEEKQRLVQEAVRELVIHASIEERILYPKIREALANGDELVDEHLEDHSEVEELLKELEEGDPTSADYDQKVGKLIADVRAHVQEEESETLPRLEEALTQDRLQELGTKLEDAKKTAPTRPHPMAPGGAAKKVTDPAAAVVDRARDAIEDR